MFDSAFDRTLTYRLASAYDCWGHRRPLRRGTRNGIWFVDASGIDEPAGEARSVDPGPARERGLAHFQSSGGFTVIELATLHALIVERLSIDEIAERHGCQPSGRSRPDRRELARPWRHSEKGTGATSTLTPHWDDQGDLHSLRDEQQELVRRSDG